MADGIELNPLAPREAIEYFRSKGFAPALQRFDYRDLWREEHARNFVVAKAMQDDVLIAIRKRLDEALANGTTLQKFQDELEPELKSLGWWGRSIERDPLTGELKDVELGSMRRLKVIFDTNMRTSYAAGQWAKIQRTKAFLPYLEYRQLERPSARDAHKPFDGLILPVDHPLWLKIFPPNGWFCGCYTRPLNQRMLDREGKTVTTDEELREIASSPWTNPRTGETEDLLDGIDPAFASNPGAAWLNTDDRHTASALDLPDGMRGYDRGYVKELSALQLRDNRDAALAYSLQGLETDPPLGMTRGAIGEGQSPLSARMNAALRDPAERVALIRATGQATSIGFEDALRFENAGGLAQVVSTAPDGSIFRMVRVAGKPFWSADLLARNRGIMIREVVAQNADLTGDDLELVLNHAMATAMARSGRARYAAAPAGRVADILAGAADLIADLISIVLPG